MGSNGAIKASFNSPYSTSVILAPTIIIQDEVAHRRTSHVNSLISFQLSVDTCTPSECKNDNESYQGNKTLKCFSFHGGYLLSLTSSFIIDQTINYSADAILG